MFPTKSTVSISDYNEFVFCTVKVYVELKTLKNINIINMSYVRDTKINVVFLKKRIFCQF